MRHAGPPLLHVDRVRLLRDRARVQRQQVVALGLRVAQRRPLPFLLGVLERAFGASRVAMAREMDQVEVRDGRVAHLGRRRAAADRTGRAAAARPTARRPAARCAANATARTTSERRQMRCRRRRGGAGATAAAGAHSCEDGYSLAKCVAAENVARPVRLPFAAHDADVPLLLLEFLEQRRRRLAHDDLVARARVHPHTLEHALALVERRLALRFGRLATQLVHIRGGALPQGLEE